MFTSASDITSNPGNAALGYSSGVSNNAFNPSDANPGANIQSTLGILAQTEAQKRAKERERQLKEQDELAAYLAGTGESVFNMKGPDGKPAGFEMLPGDKEFMNERSNQIRNKIVSEPDKWKFDAELQSNMQKFNQFKNLAGIRATEVAKRKVLAAGTNNMEERAKILKSIEDIEKEPIYSGKTPEPYLPSATWDMEGLGVSKDVWTGKSKEAWDDIIVGTEKDADGNEIIIKRPAIRGSVLDTRNRMIRGSKEFTNAENMVKAMYANPNAVSFANIFQLNQDIASYNKLRGYKPGDPNYAPPVGEVFPDSTVELPELNDSTIADIAYGLMVQKSGQAGIGKEIKKTKSDLEKEKSQREVAEGNLAVSEDQMRLNWAKFRKEEKDLSKEERVAKEKELLAEGDAVRVFEILNKNTNRKPIDQVMAAVPESERSGLYKTLKDNGIDTKDYSVSTLPVTDKEIKKLAGIPVLNKEGRPSGIAKKPTYGYVITPNDEDLSSAYFVFGYPQIREVKDADGAVVMDTKTEKPKLEEVTEWEIKSGSEAIDSYAQASNNFGTKTNDVIDKISRAQSYLGKMFEQKNTSKKQQAKQTPEYATSIMESNKEKNFIKRYLDPDKYPSIKNNDGSESTHLMASSDNIVFPMIVQKANGKLEKFSNWKDAYDYAIKNNEFIEMPTEQDAQWFAENGYKKAKRNQSAPAKEYVRTGKEIVGPELSSINEADMKEENGVRMYKYNGEWRKVVSRDEKNRLLLE